MDNNISRNAPYINPGVQSYVPPERQQQERQDSRPAYVRADQTRVPPQEEIDTFLRAAFAQIREGYRPPPGTVLNLLT